MRLESVASHEPVRSVAFRNRDGSIAVVLFNDGETPETVAVRLEGKELLTFDIAAKGAVSVRAGR